jgi:hypothetical protein
MVKYKYCHFQFITTSITENTNEKEDKELHHVKISNRFAASENSDAEVGINSASETTTCENVCLYVCMHMCMHML